MAKAPAQHGLDMWPATVWCATTKGQLRKAAKALGVELDADFHAGCTFAVDGPSGFHLIVYVDRKHHPDRLDLVDTCAHEASHVADRIFEHVEEQRPGTEARAYLVGWATRFLLTHCTT